MNIIIRKSAVRDFKKINEPHKSSIKEKIKTLEDFPSIQNIKQLTNHDPKYRLRVGNYRILFDVTETEVIVSRILHRQKSYKK
ncbi:MAG: type II toxin-antitoxin system RelE/ParE family toxin [Campylobacterota bacterium]|nr:type II toxin-antitoxin system RelE/ParE family toxin [Campylobacterota bacterium]